MTQLHKIPMATIAFFIGLFAAPASAAQNKRGKVGGFNFLSALFVVCFAAIIGGAAFAGHKDHDIPPLNQAARGGDITEVRRLIDGGTDVNTTNKNGWTPLHYAGWYGQTDIALVLIKAGADVNATNKDGRTPLHVAAQKGQTKIILLLVEAKADIKVAGNAGKTPLDIAIKHNGEDSIIVFVLRRAMEKQGG